MVVVVVALVVVVSLVGIPVVVSYSIQLDTITSSNRRISCNTNCSSVSSNTGNS